MFTVATDDNNVSDSVNDNDNGTAVALRRGFALYWCLPCAVIGVCKCCQVGELCRLSLAVVVGESPL